MAVPQQEQKRGLFQLAMDYTKEPSPKKGIFAVREVVHRDIPTIYRTRGMACAVEVEGSLRLLTWKGVINEHDQAKPNIELHRCSKKFSPDRTKYRLEKSQVKQTGRFSFISVIQSGAPTPQEDYKTFKWKVPGDDEKWKDVLALSVIGCKDVVKFGFTYDKGKHELNSPEKKGCFFEKFSILGSPIITDDLHVIGVVGEDSDGRLCPYFLTETEVGNQETEPSEVAPVNDPDIPDAPDHEEAPTTNKTVPVQESDEKTLVPPSDQPLKGTRQEECKELRGEQQKLVSGIGHDKTSSSTETVPTLESEEKIILKYLPYLALDMQEVKAAEMFWRNLGLTDGDIIGIKKDIDEDYERCYKMLKTWWQRDGTYVNLEKALKKHEFTATFEKYCLRKHDPPTGKPEELPKKLKQGCVSNEDLQNISSKVQQKRKRVGRALRLDDDNLDVIEEEHRDNISEQSYQILLKWKRKRGTEATYHALARALCDRTVMMKHVLDGYCLT